MDEKQHLKNQVLLNATMLSKSGDLNRSFEFILDHTLKIIACIEIHPKLEVISKKISKIDQPNIDLVGLLFELNHVRVNPEIDNTNIINKLTNELRKTGVNIENKPDNNSIKVCFKPLGEIRNNVRFYINNIGSTIFLSPNTNNRLKLVVCN